MSEKRFTPVEGMSCLLVGDKGVGLSSVEACDLLNSQAETIEVLRVWIQNTPQGQEMILQAQFWAARGQEPASGTWEDPTRQESKHRIAALEGK